MLFRLIRSTVAWGCAGAAGAAAAYYLTETARGTTRGAPGYTKALATLGKNAGGSMREGVFVLGATAAVSGTLTYRLLAPSAPAKETRTDSDSLETETDAVSEEPASTPEDEAA